MHKRASEMSEFSRGNNPGTPGSGRGRPSTGHGQRRAETGAGAVASPTLRVVACNAKCFPFYDFDHHKCSAAIVFFLINYANSALSALQIAHTSITSIKIFPGVIPTDLQAGGGHQLRSPHPTPHGLRTCMVAESPEPAVKLIAAGLRP